MPEAAAEGRVLFEVEQSGPAFAGVLYRLRAEEQSGILAVRDLSHTLAIAVREGLPERCMSMGAGALALDFSSWRSMLMRITTTRPEPCELELWGELFLCERATVRFYVLALPRLQASLTGGWMALIRRGLGAEKLEEAALRQRLSPLLGIRERLQLVEPIPAVLAELCEVEAAVAARLREGAAVVDLLATAHRFGAAQVEAVLRALYTLSQLGLVQRTELAASATPTSLAALELVLARARPRGEVLGSIFDGKPAALAEPEAQVEARAQEARVVPKTKKSSSRLALIIVLASLSALLLLMVC